MTKEKFSQKVEPA